MNPACSAADAHGMTDFLTKVISPPDENGERTVLYKIVTLPSTPRVTDEVYMPAGQYLPVTKLRFRQDQRIELWFDDLWAVIEWNATNLPAFINSLVTGDYVDEHPWDSPPTP